MTTRPTTRKPAWISDRIILDVKSLPDGWCAFHFELDGPALFTTPVFLGVYAENRYRADTLADDPEQPPLTERPRGIGFLTFDSVGEWEWTDDDSQFYRLHAPGDPYPSDEVIAEAWRDWKAKRG